ncbi:uncharacterized AAA domain-containing protein C31G5.19 isoform X2 [Folsomia candida]|uniref:uncharacterized AAA domain-containing protein C31G5.19 isoform X2 n=1 Tax=Folsomia candida TaxID=158441 RepID=UPI00160525C8|nr:uncharacterized AAA domain-containing protein C31G5.19 isoform X2 [Folsomia candida]
MQQRRQQMHRITFDPDKFSFEMESLLGLEEQVSFLRENVLIPAANPDLFAKLGVGLPPAKGIIFHGPATPEMANLAKALASELSRVMRQVEKDKVSDDKIMGKEGEKKKSFKFFEQPKTKIFAKYSQDGSKFVAELFTEAKKEAPCIILFEDIHNSSYPSYNNDLYCPDESFISEVNRQMENLGSTENVIVIATVPSLSLVPATHKLCFELKLAFPTKFDDETRTQIIKQTTSSWTVRPSIEILDMVTELSDSFHLEQLRRVGKMAYRSALGRALKEGRAGGCKKCANRPDNLKVDKSILDGISPSEEDWVEACDAIKSQIAAAGSRRSGSRGERIHAGQDVDVDMGESFRFMTPVDSSLTFSSVGGLEEQIKGVKENILFPLQNKDNLAEWGVHPVRGILFHGPPGTGKTLLGRVLAAELTRLTSSSVKKAKFSFFYQKASDCFNLYVGETERNLRELFAEAERCKPSIIFFDEMDGLCPSRDNRESSRWSNSTVATLLGLMDTVKRGEVFVIAATNRLTSIDPAMRRPGRFDKEVAFHVPKEDGRKVILQIHTKAWKKGNEEEVLGEIARQTEGWSGADLEQLCRQTFVFAIRRHFSSSKVEEPEPETALNPKYELRTTKTPTFENFDILPCDWHESMSTMKPSRTNVFGDSALISKPLPNALHKLLEGTVSAILAKILPLIRGKGIKCGSFLEKASSLKSFYIWGNTEKKLKSIHAHLIPSLLSSHELRDVIAFTLDLSGVPNQSDLGSTFDQVFNPGEGKTSILFIPGIDKLERRLTKLGDAAAEVVEFILEQIGGFRGEGNVLLLGTGSVPSSELVPEFASIFKGTGNSRTFEMVNPTQEAYKELFLPLLQSYPAALRYFDDTCAHDKLDIIDALYLKGELELEISKAGVLVGSEKTAEEMLLKMLESFQKDNTVHSYRMAMYS